MSRLPNVSYDYSEADYYYQDTVGCYQEGYMEQVVYNPYAPAQINQNGNFTEIYRRPATVPVQKVTPHDDRRFSHLYYDYPEYYYENHQQQVYDPKSGQYYVMPPPSQEIQYRPASHHQSRMYSDVQGKMQVATEKQPVKRYPITVKTPRFYKRPHTIYKRPSALCLPIISQPDPASTTRRHKKIHQTVNQPEEMPPQEKKYELHEVPSTHKMDSEGDVNLNSKLSHLEQLLAKYERESRIDPLCIDSKSDLAKLAMTLKPKVPSTVKLRQERQKRKRFQNFDIQELPRTQLSGHGGDDKKMTPDALDKLLNKLKKCEVSSNSAQRIATKETKSPRVQSKQQLDDDDDPEPLPVAPKPKSFNYKEITEQLKKCQSAALQSAVSTTSNDTARSDAEENTFNQVQPLILKESKLLTAKMPPLDDHCALELHRSKSYIVNLIDRALSKELGTVPGERFQKNKFETMNTKKAIELVNRHCSSNTKQQEGDASPTVLANPPNACASIPSKTCACQEEPTYIKQLKQLRWGHLKHIQREVQRLEDLERFLDACTEGTEEQDY